MGLKEQIQIDRKEALIKRKTEKRKVLSTLLGELDRIDKNPSDAQIIKKIKGLIESNKLTNLIEENKYLINYLPKLMSKKEIETIIKDYINKENLSGSKGIGLVMKYLKNNYIGQYDGKIASEITKKELIQ